MEKKRFTLIILLSVIVVIFVIAGGIYYWQKKPPSAVQVVQDQTEKENWKTYKNEMLGFSFEYPVSWGDVNVEADPFTYDPNDPEDAELIELFYSHIDLDKALTERYSLSFTGKPCSSKKEWCDIGFQAWLFNSSKPLEVICYEGICDSKNLTEDRTFLQQNFNKLIGGRKGHCKEGYFPPGANLNKYCRTYNGNMKLELQMGYSVKNFKGIKIDYENLSFEQVYDRLENRDDFNKFLSNYERVLDSIIFLDTKEKVVISDWKTYRNANDGFQVMYPNDWNLDPFGTAKTFNLTSLPKSAYGQGGVLPRGGAEITIWNSSSVSEELTKDDLRGGQLVERNPYIIAGINAAKIIYKIPTTPLYVEKNIVVYLPKDSNVYKFILTYYENDPREKEFTDIFEKILLTFKFLLPPKPISTQTQTLTLTTPLVGGKIIISGLNINIESAFKKTGKQSGQNLTSFDMPVHPINKDIIFLSTAEPLNETHSRIINRIYSYNLKTSEQKEIYSEIDENNSPFGAPVARILRTVGIDGSKIIVLYDDSENSPGPCTRIWYHYKDQMGYLEIADVQSGLKSYIVPAYKVEEDRIDVDKCLSELQ